MESTLTDTSDRALSWSAIAAGSALLALAMWRRPVATVLAAAAGAGLWLVWRANNSAEREKDFAAGSIHPKRAAPAAEESAGEFNAVDQASWESFPASDPPASHQITS